jgi:hypothetical protein
LKSPAGGSVRALVALALAALWFAWQE